MSQKKSEKVTIKCVAPWELKIALERLAASRNISLSALLRLILTGYLRTKGVE